MPRDPILDEGQRQQFIEDGYVVVRGLLPAHAVNQTKDALVAAHAELADPSKWHAMDNVFPNDFGLTMPCWTDSMLECAVDLAGPDILRDKLFSPFREMTGQDPWMAGYIPVLVYPTPGSKRYEEPQSCHIDGLHRTALYPESQYLVVFAYLTDVSDYSGATSVWPGSHRRVFEHHIRNGKGPGDRISDKEFDFEYGSPIPVVGKAGDVIFMHYLLIHSGSANHSASVRIGLNSAIQPDPLRPYVRKTGEPTPNWSAIDWTLQIPSA